MVSLLSLTFAALATALPIRDKRDLFLPEPYHDTFYTAPSNLDQLKNGEVYNTRKIVPDLEMSIGFSECVQIAYKTTDPTGQPSHSVATVFKPLITSSEPRLFSYQFWEDADELNCSPSYTLAKGFLSPDWITGTLDSAVTIQFGLSKGWYVVVPDHEGPKSAFIEGLTQGQTGLDGIQAAINYFELAQDVKTALFGYSGGASATVWMTNLHESYAPNINIVGAAFGGTPIDLTATIKWLDRPDRLFSGFIVGAFTGLLNAFPAAKEVVWPHLHPTLQNAVNTMDTPDNCVPTEILKFQHTEWLNQMDEDIFTWGPTVAVMKMESLLKNVTTSTYSTPKFPRYIYHADADEVIPVGPVRQYIQEQCAGGANIQYVPWKGDDHVSVEFLGLPDAYQFLIQSFEGKTPQLKCGTRSNDILTLGSTTVGDVIGQVIADLIKAVSGFTAPWGKINFDPNQPYQP